MYGGGAARRHRVIPVLAVVATLAACGGGGARAEADARRAHASMSLRQQAGQLLMMELGDARGLPPQTVAAALAAVEFRAERGEIGGVWVQGGTARELALRLADLQAASATRLLVGVALERGAGASIDGATEIPVLSAAHGVVEAERLRAAGRLAGREAAAAGANLGIVELTASPRTGSAGAAEAGGAAAFLEGLAESGLLPAAAVLLSRSGPPSAGAPASPAWDRAWLASAELPLLDAAMAAGAVAILVPERVVPALTGDSTPLPFSPVFVAGMLRRDHGFEGLVIADLRPGPATPLDVVRAVRAGADLVLGVADPAAAVDSIVGAVATGRLAEARVAEASLRVLHAKAAAGLLGTAPRAERRLVGRDGWGGAAAAEFADQLFAATALGFAWTPADPGTAVLLAPATGAEPLIAGLDGSGRSVRHLPLARDEDAARLAARLRAATHGAAQVIHARFEDEHPALGARVDSARAEIGATPAWLELRFRTVPALPAPAAPGTLVVWGDGSAAQRAAARLLSGAAASEAMIRVPVARELRPGRAAEAGMSEARLARADAILEDAVADGLFPGAALAVGRRGVLVRLRGYGRLHDAADSPPVDPAATLYDVASLTKVLGTTAAAMVLVDDGHIELDAPLARYLPEWAAAANAAADPVTALDRQGVTVRRLLAHTAGVPAGLALHASPSPDQALARILAVGPVLEPGAVALYSDLGMILLAEALGRAAGEPLDRFLARRVFRPLGMESTLFLPPLALRPRIAPSARTAPDEWPMHGIVHDGTAFRLGGVAGHAGLFSTAHDVAVFAQTMLNGGAYGARRIVEPATVARFSERQPGAAQRALGWDTPAPESSAGSYFSERAYGHTGFTGTSVWIDPEHELFVVLLTNRTYERTSLLRMLELRARVHDAVALAVVDSPARRRPGAVDPIPPPRVPAVRVRR